MKKTLSFWFGLLFLFMPAFAAHLSIYAPELIAHEWVVGCSVLGFLLWSIHLLSNSEISQGQQTLAEGYFVASYLIYIVLASYAQERGIFFGWFFVIYTLVAVYLMVKLFSKISPSLFSYASSLEKGKYGLVMVSTFWLFAFWAFFWLRALNQIYLPSLLSGFVGIALLLISIIAWFVLKELPIVFRPITSSIYFSFYISIIIALIVFPFMWVDGISPLYPTTIYSGFGYDLIRVAFMVFWIIFAIYTQKLYSKYDKQFESAHF